ncbi:MULTISPECIES: FlgO family outer membrane protein [unclassified Acidovorax]|uniref:FlgO family outer membrane protein n=1 Tax=unclassified Acidovorax TaxID=2684926 RepID=UPI002882F8B2|nr:MULTISPECIES: FlgO family outer membrane protein [unclassified Acidovorax]
MTTDRSSVSPPGRRLVLRAALAAAATVMLGATGCARFYYGSAAPTDPVDLVEANYRAADVLLQTAPLDPTLPVLVATIVQVDRLSESSRLGRVISEHISGRLAQRGVRVTELKLRETLAMRPGQGELLLSREAREVTQAQSAQAVVVGTYAVSSGAVFVSLKLVNPVGNIVLAACDYALPMDGTVRGLVAAQ